MNNQGLSGSPFNQSTKTSNLSQSTSNTPLTEQSNSPSTEKRKFPFLWIALALLGGAMFLPLQHQVGGKVELDTLEDLRSHVVTGQSTPCTVKEIFVKIGSTVNVGDKLAELSCRALNESIYKIKDELSQAKMSLAELNINSSKAKADLERERSKSQAAREEALRADNQVSGGVAESQINKLDEEKKGLQKSLDFARIERDRFKYMLDNKIGTQRDLDKAEAAYKQVEANISVKDAEIELVERQLKDMAQTKKLIADNQVNVAEGSELIYDAVLAAANLREKIVNLEAYLKDLENQQKNLILKAEKAGTVYSINNADLDTLKGRELAANAPVIDIFRTNQLVAKVKVEMRDYELVQIGKPVQFRAEQAKNRPYSGNIDSKQVDPKPTDSSQIRTATVRLTINNDDQKLAPNAIGYAKIYSQDMFVFQRIQLEISRFIDTKFW